MKELNLIAKDHQKWVNIVKSFGAEYPEDIVQDMYIKIHEWQGKYNKTIMYNDEEVNYYFIYITLRNLFLNQVRRESKETNIEDYQHPQTIDAGFYYDVILNEVKKEIEDWHLYDRKIYELVFIHNKSMLELSNDTGIDYYSIYRTVKKIKKIIHSIIDK